jgi:hypothetical protein
VNTSVAITEFDAPIAGPSAAEAAAMAEALSFEGAIVVRGAIAAESIPDLRDALVRALVDDERRYGAEYRFRGMVHALMTRGAAFLDLLKTPTLRRVSQAMLGDGCIVHAFNSSSLPPRGQNHSRGIHVDCPRLIPNYATNVGWIFPLDEFTDENGAMELIPPSFMEAERPSEEEFSQDCLSLAGLKPGDACCFNARCWHRGGINLTNEWRHAATVNVTRSYIRQQFDYPRMIAPRVLESLGEELRRFLGCHVRMPVSLEEFHLPPDLRPYRPGQE